MDLGGLYAINEIRVWNQTDADWRNQSKDFYLVISEYPIIDSDGFDKQQRIGPFSFKNYDEPLLKIQLDHPGRFIRIFTEGYTTLSLAEVEIFGTAPSLTKLDDVATTLTY